MRQQSYRRQTTLRKDLLTLSPTFGTPRLNRVFQKLKLLIALSLAISFCKNLNRGTCERKIAKTENFAQ